MELIRVNNLDYMYPINDGEKALKNVSLSIREGKLYAVIGKNGTGKTTLCNVLRGFIPHFHKGSLEGEVVVEGKDIRHWTMSELAKNIGFIFQNPFTQISGVKDTVFGEIAYGLENLGVEVPEIKKRVKQVIQLLNIEELADKNPYELSGGQKQRVAFAAVIVMDPDILVIDEPTSQLDPKGTRDIFDMIKWMKEQGKTIILVEHKLELIAEHADYLFVMNDGRIITEGNVEDVLSNPALIDYEAGLPQYARLGIELNKRSSDFGQIPIHRSQAEAEIKKWLGIHVNQGGSGS
ncbi:ATP-binding cassette domain-containing protein [Salinibacillus aidingensis]|uniref:ATP-binding cassette domain-containing protein n=1 Tax=Salinibacillus aidingensis TaxID=237684 RepID=A0ABN1AXP8_9BACI